MTVRTLVGNFASMASLRIALAGLTFAQFWLLSHRMNTGELGGFSLLMNVFFMVQALPLLGLNVPLMRRIAAHPGAAPAECSSSLCFALPVSAVLAAVLAGVGLTYRAQGLSIPFALLGLGMLPTAWTVVAECVLIGQERMQGIAYVNMFETLGRFLGAWAAIEMNAGLTGVFLVFVAMRCAAAAAYFLNPHVPKLRRLLVRRDLLATYRRELPTYLSIALVAALTTRIDIIVLSKLLSLREAGIYAAASRLSDAALMVPTMAAVVIFPTQSRLFANDPAVFARVLEQALRWCMISGFAMTVLVVALSPALVHAIYSPHLAAAAPILQVLILGATVMVLDQLLSTTMMAAQAQHTDLRSLSIGLGVLTVLLVLGAHFFGLVGAAAAPPAALMVRVLYRMRWAQNALAVSLLGMAARIAMPAAAAIALVFVRPSPTMTVDLLLAFLAYAGLLWATRSIRGADVAALRQLVTQNRGLRT